MQIIRSMSYPFLGLVAALCLAPAAAGAAEWNPTASDGHSNTAAGGNALDHVTGFSNTAVGYQALFANTGGNYNAAGGSGALHNNTLGSDNTATGANTLYNNLSGNYNTADGTAALYINTTGNNNTATGFQALVSNTGGNNNTAAGYQVLGSNTTGSNNTAVGNEALYASTTANYNVAVGAGALRALASGGNNIALGVDAGKATTKGVSNIYIGSLGFPGTENKTIRLGQVQTRTFIAGVAGTPVSGASVVISANGRLGVVASSARYKTDIRPLDDAADKLARLQPVSYRYKVEPEATHYGLVAEEVDAVMPELVVRDGENRPESVQYLELIPLLLQQWKAQQAEIAREHAENVRQHELIERQQTELAALRRTLASRLAAHDGGTRE
jgi:hypothetical protein